MRKNIPVLVLLMTTSLIIIGCNDRRKHRLSFINTSEEDIVLSITGPDGITHDMGIVERKFGFQHLGVVVHEDEATEEIPPVSINCKYGDKHTSVILDDHSDRNIWIGLPGGELVNPRKIVETLTTNDIVIFKQKEQSAKKEERIWVSY